LVHENKVPEKSIVPVRSSNKRIERTNWTMEVNNFM
jgi:hypothetical protein